MAPSLFITIFALLLSTTISQSQPSAPSPASDACNGVYLSYSYSGGAQLPPTLKSDPTHQPYRFQSTLTILNNGLDDLKSWKVFVGFKHNEFLVSASNAVLADGTILPAGVGNGTVFAGYPSTDLKTAVETAGDLTQMSVQIDLVGTQFGVGSPSVPMPSNISLANDGFVCPKPTLQGTSEMQVCCTKDPNFKSNATTGDEFLPRQNGDLTIMYDVIRTYDSNYWAQVTISNHNPLGRLDNWKLSWDWMRDEFIYTMKRAYPYLVDSSDCVFGRQGQYYKDLDFSNVLNCERRPTLIDLPLEKTNDTTLGMIPFCCRNGTILPPSMDPSKSTSVFQINVFKMPPDLNRSQLTPPQNWKINGTLNPDYQCGPPVRVSPSQFPDSSGLPSDKTAFASWQVVCNTSHSQRERARGAASHFLLITMNPSSLAKHALVGALVPPVVLVVLLPRLFFFHLRLFLFHLRIEPIWLMLGLILSTYPGQIPYHVETTAVSASTGIYTRTTVVGGLQGSRSSIGTMLPLLIGLPRWKWTKQLLVLKNYIRLMEVLFPQMV